GRIIERLCTLGRKARQHREMQKAAGYFNRALAFRPDNTELLAEVAGLARRQRMRRTLQKAAIGVVAVSALLAAGLLSAHQLTLSDAVEPSKKPDVPQEQATPQRPTSSPPEVASAAPPRNAPSAKRPDQTRPTPRRRPSRLARPAP